MKVRLMFGALAASAVLGLVGCSGDNDAGAAADPSRSGEQSDAQSASASDTAGEADPYHEALDRWQAYRRESAPIMARGEATERSAEVFREYFHDWQPQQSLMQQLEQSGLTFRGVKPS